MLDLYIFKYKTFDINDVPINIIDNNLINSKKLIHYYSWVKLREVLIKYNIDIDYDMKEVLDNQFDENKFLENESISLKV